MKLEDTLWRNAKADSREKLIRMDLAEAELRCIEANTDSELKERYQHGDVGVPKYMGILCN